MFRSASLFSTCQPSFSIVTMRLLAMGEALLAPHSLHVATSFDADEDEAASVARNLQSSGGMCSAEGDMIWQKTPDGRQSKYSLCYAPADRNSGTGPTGGGLQCDANSYISLEAPRFCCRNPRILIEGEKLRAQTEVCGDVQAEFDPNAQKIRYVRGPSSDGTPELQEKLEASSVGTTLPSPIGIQAMREESDWKLILSERCKGRDGTLIQWPSGRVEMCPAGTQPVHGRDYLSWQCDGAYKTERRLHCCMVKGKMKCVPHLVDQGASMKCNCPGVGGSGEESAGSAEGDHPQAAQSSIGLPPLPVLLFTTFGMPGQLERPCRRGCTRQIGQKFL